jgi:hypothetical protein
MNETFMNFWPLIEYGLHWINFTILIFISEKNRYSKGLYKFWNKIISFDMEKKKENLRQVIRKMEKMVNLSVLRVSP